MKLLDQIKRATAKELAGYQPMSDQIDRSVFELLDTVNELIDGLTESPEEQETIDQLRCVVSMIRVKLGFPATVHTKPCEAP